MLRKTFPNPEQFHFMEILEKLNFFDTFTNLEYSIKVFNLIKLIFFIFLIILQYNSIFLNDWP